MVRRTVLDNSLRVVAEDMPDVPSVTVGIWVESGSRHEQQSQNGISHFVEHLLFKGTEDRTAAEIAQSIDGMGGVCNAFTGKEHTCYYIKVLAEHLPLGLRLLADIFLRSVFDRTEIERERSVILQEISHIGDTPDDFIHDLFAANFWAGHALCLPVCGSAETVSGLTRADFLRWVDLCYRPDRTIIAAAGCFEHDELLERVTEAFGELSGTAVLPDGSQPEVHSGVFIHEKDLEQVHVCLGLPGLPQADPDRYTAYVLNGALGGGVSSRLFQEIRERRGRAYSIYSDLASFCDTGYLAVYAGTSAEWVSDVVEVTLRETERLASEGLEPGEIERVRNQVKGSLLLGLESSDSRMGRLARNEMYFGCDISPGEVSARLGAVQNDAVVALAQRLFRDPRRSLSLLGDLRGHKIDPGLLGTV